MADQDLTITLRWAAEAAEQMEMAYHRRAQQRIRETAEVQSKAERETKVEREHNLKEIDKLEKEHQAEWKRRQAERKGLMAQFDRDQKASRDRQSQAVNEYAAAQGRAARQSAAAWDKASKESAAAWKRNFAAAVDASVDAMRSRMASMWKRMEADAKAAANAETRISREADADRLRVHKETAAQIKKIDDDIARNRAKAESTQAKADGSAAAGEDAAAAERRRYRIKLEAATQYSRSHSELAKEAAAESIGYSKRAEEAEKAGQARAAATYRGFSKEKLGLAKQEAAESQRYASDAAKFAKKSTDDMSMFSKNAATSIANTAKTEADSTQKFIEKATDSTKKSAIKSADVQVDSSKRVGNAIEQQQKKIGDVARAYTQLRIAAVVAQGLEHAWKAVENTMKETEDHVKSMVDNMEALRKSSAEIFAMQGKPQTAASVAEMAGKAERAHVETGSYQKFTTEVQSNVQGHIQPKRLDVGDAEMAMMPLDMEYSIKKEQSQYRVTQGQVDSLTEWALPYAKSQGMEDTAAGNIFSLSVTTAPRGKDGKIDESKFKDQFARTLETLQLNRGRASQTAAQFSVVAQKMQGQGAGTKDMDQLARIFGAQAEMDPRTGRVHTDALFRELDQIRNKEAQAEEIGITPKMNDLQALDQAVKHITETAKSEGLKGEEGERTVARRYFNDDRGLDAVMAHLNIGVRKGLYNRVEAQQKHMNAKVGDAKIKAYSESPEGIRATESARSDKIDARLTSGKYEKYTNYERQVRNDNKESGELDIPEDLIGAVLTNLGKGHGFESREDLYAYQQMGKGIRQGLENHRGNEEAQKFLKSNGNLLEVSIAHPWRNKNLQAAGLELWQKLDMQTAVRTADGKSTEPIDAGAIQERTRRVAFEQMKKESNEGQFRRSFQGMSWNDAKDKLYPGEMKQIDARANQILGKAIGGELPGRITSAPPEGYLPEANADKKNLPGVGNFGNEIRRRFPARNQTDTEYNRVLAEAAALRGEKANEEMLEGIDGVGPILAKPEVENIEGHLVPSRRKPLHVVLPPGLMDAAATEKLGGRHTDRRHRGRHHRPGHQRAKDFHYAIPLDQMRKHAVDWDVEPSPAATLAMRAKADTEKPAYQAYRSRQPSSPSSVPSSVGFLGSSGGGVAAMHGGAGMDVAAKELRMAARDMKRDGPAAIPGRPNVQRN